MFLLYLFIISTIYSITPHQHGGSVPRFIGEKQIILNGNSVRNETLGRSALSDVQSPPSNYRIPVLLIGFSNESGTISKETFQEHLFGANITGSLSDYYDEISDGQFNVTGDVFGWYSSDKSEAETYDAEGIDVYKVSQYITTAIESIPSGDINFSDYDNDNDGIVDVVMVVFPGAGEDQGASGNNLWPHKSSLLNNEGTGYYVSPQGINFSQYLVCPEKTTSGFIRPIGVFAHEFGHALGLPDLYDTTPAGDADSEGLGNWCLMAAGSWGGNDGDTPVHMSAWCKYKLGWVDPVLLTSENYQDFLNNDNKLYLNNIAENPSSIYKVYADGYQWNEYFLLENRQLVNFDSGLPGEGLMIYHIDENQNFGANSAYGSNNDNVAHKLVDIEEADGYNHLDTSNNGRGDTGDPFPGSSSNSSFNDSSNPSNYNYSGYSSSVSFGGINQSEEGVISMDISIPQRDGEVLAYDSGIAGAITWIGSDSIDDYYAVKFTTSENSYLKSVDIGLWYDADIDIYVYRSMTAGIFSDNPSNKLYEASHGNVLSGWSTLPLGEEEEGIQFDAGESFYICVRNKNNYYGVNTDLNSESSVNNSYFKSSSGIYYSSEAGEGGNFCIRARLDKDGGLGLPSFELPLDITINDAYPNPFNPILNLSYSMGSVKNVSIKIYNLKGELVAEPVNRLHSPGDYMLSWNAGNISSGIYFIKYSTKHNTFTQKVILIK